MKVFCTILLLACSVCASADQSVAVEWAHTSDRLSNGSPDWRSDELRLSTQLAPRHTLDGTLRTTRRFGLEDTQIEVNYGLPLSSRLTASLNAGGSSSHRVLPRSDLSAGVHYEFAPGWLVNASAGNAEYDQASVTKATLGFEHYFAAFRWAATWRPARAVGTLAQGGDLRVDYYFNDVDTFGITLASGEEASNIGARGVVVSSVRSAALTGRLGIGRGWLLRYGVERVKQGDFYDRTGVRLGAQHAF